MGTLSLDFSFITHLIGEFSGDFSSTKREASHLGMVSIGASFFL